MSSFSLDLKDQFFRHLSLNTYGLVSFGVGLNYTWLGIDSATNSLQLSPIKISTDSEIQISLNSTGSHAPTLQYCQHSEHLCPHNPSPLAF